MQIEELTLHTHHLADQKAFYHTLLYASGPMRSTIRWITLPCSKARATPSCKVWCRLESESIARSLMRTSFSWQVRLAQCESMALEAAAGEQELHYAASRQQHLWVLLGMKMGEDMIREPVQPIPEEHVQLLSDKATKQKSRVGEQQPVRLEVGEPQDKGSTENCPFSGTVVELQPAQIRATGVEKLQCPVCGAARKATIRGELVIYSPHTPLRMTRANKDPLWIRQGTTWTKR
jgi:hypothetical protein